MSDDDEPCGWGAPCEAQPETPVALRFRKLTFKVKAYTFGAWAVHRAIALDGFDLRPDPDSWGVSHVPTGFGIGQAMELDFWDAVRIARALEDTEHFTGTDLAEDDGLFVFEAAIGAALHDHYVWPLGRP